MEDLQHQIKSSSSQTQAVMFLKALVDLEKGLVSAEALLNGDVVKQVISCLNSESTSTSVLEAATELVAALFSHDAVKKAVASKPRLIVDALFTCLRNNSNVPVAQQHILTAIGNLTDDEDPSQNWLVSDYDAINIIVNVLEHSPNLADLQVQAYCALQKIAMGNKTNIIFLFNTHLAHQLALKSMTNHATHIPLQTQSCALLRRLSFLEETHSVLMTTAAATVIQSMRSFVAEPKIQEHGCIFIENLGRDDENEKLLVGEPHLAHQVVLSAMRNHPQVAAVQENGCCALRNLAVDADNKKLLVREPHLAHQVILSAMRNHSQIAVVQEKGCGALCSLAVDDDNKKLLVLEPHLAHQVILSAMRNHSQISKVQEYGCAALWSLADDADNKKLLVREPHLAHQVVLSASATILKSLRFKNKDVVLFAIWLWTMITRNCLFKTMRTPPRSLLLKSIHNTPEVVQLYAVWALASLSLDVSNRAILNQVDPLPLCEKAQRNFSTNNDLAAQLTTLKRNLA